MSAFNVLKQTNLLDWHALLVGLEHGWCKRDNLIDYADAVLRQAADEIDSDLVTIAISGKTLSADDLIATVVHFLDASGRPMSPEKKSDALEKWRFAHLSWLLQREGSVEEKVSELQELYAQFGFPNDMAPCSIYSCNGVPPLVAVHNVVDELSRRFGKPT